MTKGLHREAIPARTRKRLPPPRRDPLPGLRQSVLRLPAAAQCGDRRVLFARAGDRGVVSCNPPALLRSGAPAHDESLDCVGTGPALQREPGGTATRRAGGNTFPRETRFGSFRRLPRSWWHTEGRRRWSPTGKLRQPVITAALIGSVPAGVPGGPPRRRPIGIQTR